MNADVKKAGIRAYWHCVLYCAGIRFWWLWLRLAHKHGWEKAVVDARCRFWGFKFLPNVDVDGKA